MDYYSGTGSDGSGTRDMIDRAIRQLNNILSH